MVIFIRCYVIFLGDAAAGGAGASAALVTSDYTTANLFVALHKKNREHGKNIRGQVNAEYNRLLEEQGLKEDWIPGIGIDALGRDQITALR